MSEKITSEEIFLLDATPRDEVGFKQKGQEMVQRTLRRCLFGIFRGTV